MQNFKSLVDDFNRHIDENRFTEALQRFYREDMVSIDNDSVATQGRDEMIVLANTFLERSKEFSTRVLSSLISDHISVIEREYTFSTPDGAHYHFKQVSIQQWADGKIWHERHLYSL